MKENTEEVFDGVLRQARLRWKLRRVIDIIPRILWLLVILVAVAGVMSLVFPKFISWLPVYGAGLGLAVLIAILGAWLWPVKDSRIWKQVDQSGDLKDGVLTTQELQTGNEPSAWSEVQREKIAAEVDWGKIRDGWSLRPVNAPRMAVLVFAIMSGLVAYRYFTYVPPVADQLAVQMVEEQKKAVDTLLEDWEQAQKENPSETLKKAIEELKPLQERLAKGDLTDKQMMTELSRVENKLQAMQDEMKKQVMSAAMAQEMAQAMEPMQGASGLAAALQRNDLEAAQQKAAEAAKAWEKPDAKVLDGNMPEAAQQKLNSLAAQSDRQKMGQMGEALRQLAAGGQKNDAKQMAQGMKQLQESLAKQSNCQSCQKSLSLQMKQLGSCKSCMGNGKNPSMGLSMIPSLSLARQKNPGKGAGSAQNPNLMGAETALNSERTQEKLQGAAGEGESEITTEKTTMPTPAGISSTTQADFQAYEKLSGLAVEDENLPLAYREAIKRYFATIHPRDSN